MRNSRPANAMQVQRSGSRRKESKSVSLLVRLEWPQEKLMQGPSYRGLYLQSVPGDRTAPQSSGRPPVPQAGRRLARVIARKKKPIAKGSIAQAPVREANCPPERKPVQNPRITRFRGRSTVTPNPSIERTSTGRPHLAFISFWAKCALPVPAAHVKR